MKNIKTIIALLAVVVLTCSALHAGNLNMQCSIPDKDPWQIMQATLYNHNMDTTDLSVESPIDFQFLLEILPDLEKAYQVKTNVYIDYTTLGDVICAFMNAKYANRSGETYDYYKTRYSSRPSYRHYLEKYPNSPCAEEMRLKMECIEQSRAWSSCDSMEDYYNVYNTYGPGHCPYGGFFSIAKMNNLLRENIALYDEYSSSWDHDGTSVYDTLADNSYEDINSSLVVPSKRIGHSVFFVGNSCKTISYTVSFIGASVIEVTLEPGQHEWIELENGKYKVKITSASGIEWWPYGIRGVVIEDAVYAGFWFDYNFNIDFTEDVDYDSRAIDAMYVIVLRRGIDELTSIMQLDYETQRILVLRFMQKIYSGEKNPEKIVKYADKENIENTLVSMIEEFKIEEERIKRACGW